LIQPAFHRERVAALGTLMTDTTLTWTQRWETSDVIHRCNPYHNNRIEQDHRGIKQRYYSMRCFGNVESAARFCRAFDE
jgi:transposase-like protein